MPKRVQSWPMQSFYQLETPLIYRPAKLAHVGHSAEAKRRSICSTCRWYCTFYNIDRLSTVVKHRLMCRHVSVSADARFLPTKNTCHLSYWTVGTRVHVRRKQSVGRFGTRVIGNVQDIPRKHSKCIYSPRLSKKHFSETFFKSKFFVTRRFCTSWNIFQYGTHCAA